jgi:ACS family tartrate transporter-like MFS transporter
MFLHRTILIIIGLKGAFLAPLFQKRHKFRLAMNPGEEAMDDTLKRSTMRKVYLRLLPFAILSYVLAYIDRINVSFAGLTMRGDLGMSAGTFGLAVGMFYWGYFIFEVPSNVILEKVGARIWIARIMITWGVLAGLTAMVTGSTSFAIVRFLLGVAEAGFFPGIILYFTYWFPSHHHARIVSGFLVGLPVAVAVGVPISTGLLGLEGLFGLPGWQVMYIAEAIPTVVIGVITFFVLTDRPQQANSLPRRNATGSSPRSPPNAAPRRRYANSHCGKLSTIPRYFSWC